MRKECWGRRGFKQRSFQRRTMVGFVEWAEGSHRSQEPVRVVCLWIGTVQDQLLHRLDNDVHIRRESGDRIDPRME